MVGCVLLLAPSAEASAQFVTDPVKNDTLYVRNGDIVTGEFRQLARGLVTFKTDAMATVSVKWTRVLTAKTDKQFEINLSDGRRYYGGLRPSQTAGRVTILGESDTLEVAVRAIVDMVRLKGSFFRRMDGSFNLGANYTQQNNKVDLTFTGTLRYVHRRNRLTSTLNTTLTRQDSVADITRATFTVGYAREFDHQWLVGGIFSLEQNSQLSLEHRTAFSIGPGRYWVQSNKVLLANFVQVAVTEEQFTDEDPRNTTPLSLVTDLQWFNWAGLSTDLSSNLNLQRVIPDAGRWRIIFVTSLSKELVNNLYLTVSISEQYDSNPPAEDANKNDFTIQTGLSYTFF